MLQINSSIIDLIISVIIGFIVAVILMRIVIWYAKLMGYIPDFKKKKHESINNLEVSIIDEKRLYQSEEYSKFELKTELIKNTLKNLINIPKMCPICNQYAIEGYFNYKLKDKEYIEIPLCKEHYKKAFEIGRYKRSLYMISKYVRLGYSKDSITIVIKNANWSREFKSLNNWKEIPDFSNRIKTYRKKQLKLIILCILITIPITVVSLVFFPIYYKVIIYFFVFIPILIIIIIIMFLKGQTFGRQSLSASKLLALIFLSIFLFIFITLYYFEMIPIF